MVENYVKIASNIKNSSNYVNFKIFLAYLPIKNLQILQSSALQLMGGGRRGS